MEARLDKWLWAARIYKTRTLAADACKNGRVSINGAQAKPSRTVKAGDEVAVKKSARLKFHPMMIRKVASQQLTEVMNDRWRAIL